MLKFKGERSTWTTWDRQDWDEAFITTYIRSIAKDWYTWLLEHTSGNAKSRLREIAELDKGKAFEFRASVMGSYGGFTDSWHEQIDVAQQGSTVTPTDLPPPAA